MANFTLNQSPRFRNGVTVTVHDGTGFDAWPGVPPGPAVASGAMTSSGVTFTGLTAGRRYFAYESTGGNHLAFSPDGASEASAFQGAGPPSSGTAGTLAGATAAGATYTDTASGVLYVNEGTSASPYWTPVSYDQTNLFGVATDFRSQVGEPLADTDAELVLASGLRVFGQGLAETDSGAVVQTAGEGGSVLRLTTTDEAAHTVAIGTEAGIMQPDQHDQLVIDVELTNVSAITNRAVFVGFVGAAADALDPVVTGATTTATLVLDDLAGVWFDTGLTDGDRLFAVSEKSNLAGTQALATNGDTGVDIAAAGTYQRIRVEINASGRGLVFVNKAQVAVIPGATGAGAHSLTEDCLDADEEVSPVLYIESNSAAVQSLDVRRFATWANRL